MKAAVVFAVLSLIAGIIAAWLWWKSSRIVFPNPPQQNMPISAAYHQRVSEAISEVAKWNRYAAIATGIAALMGAISSVLG
jgi:hypothetical protein